MERLKQMRRKWSLRIFSGVLALCLANIASTPVFAHEFILKPVQVGDKSRVEAQAAHVFMVSEEMEPLQDVELFAVQADLKRLPLSLEENQVAKSLQADLPEDGSAYLLLGHRKPQLWSDTTDDVQAGGRQELEERGYKVLSVGRYEKFAKLLLKQGAGVESARLSEQIVGDPLEIVLLNDPAALKPGDKLSCRVLWQGKPLQTEVKAGRDGFSPEADTYTASVKSNAEGIAEFPIDQPGIWFIRAGHTEPVNDASYVDKWVVSATYTFVVE